MQLAGHQRRLLQLTVRHKEIMANQATLQQVQAFSSRLIQKGLERNRWSFYEVNVQGSFSYDAARKIIGQCSDSAAAYYWPGSMEIKVPDKTAPSRPASPSANDTAPGDVQLTVIGKFVARK